eukprot:TRINITY_DN35386_c0_g1_i1.p1 TRINITY_DN35386_c0_g1~~TRINITY_DN35386_c0_g1_i1.p1  ORF type:complete len:136 (-),score=31.23 TRINITY_DN35386_c0_g1_i1:443-850(-)
MATANDSRSGGQEPWRGTSATGEGQASSGEGAQVQVEDMVKLISAEGFEYVVSREAAMVSNTIRNMLSSAGGFQEADTGEVRFPEITAPILEKLCQYFYYKLRYSQPANQKNIPEFKIEPEIALELLMAANYLDT